MADLNAPAEAEFNGVTEVGPSQQEDQDERSRLEWSRERRRRRMREQMLPRAIRREIDRVHRPDLAQALMDDVMALVDQVAKERGLTQFVDGDMARPDREVVPAVHRRTILEDLARHPQFVARVGNRRDELLRGCHQVKVDPAATVTSLPSSINVRSPGVNDPWMVAADLGLGTASFLDGGPEGWFAWVAQEVIRDQARDDVDADRSAMRRVLCLHAGPGALARAVSVLAPSDRAARIQEEDHLMPEATALPCVVGRNQPTPWKAFDTVVSVFPACSIGGASNHRRIYVPSGTTAWTDISSVGPKKWRRAVRDILTAVGDLGVTGYFLFPLGVRVGEGYADAPGLLDGLLDGLSVAKRIETVEVGSVNQPFVGTRRPKYVTVVIQGSARP